MKTIILLISMAVAFVSCETGKRIEKENRHNLPKIIVTEQYDQKGILIVDIEHEGNRHEFIMSTYSYSPIHWPSCKYCEDNKQENNYGYHQLLATAGVGFVYNMTDWIFLTASAESLMTSLAGNGFSLNAGIIFPLYYLPEKKGKQTPQQQ